MEMTGLWKEWKAKIRLPTSFHEPLGNLAQNQGDIPTFPQPGEAVRKSGKPKGQVFHFPLPLLDDCWRIDFPNQTATTKKKAFPRTMEIKP